MEDTVARGNGSKSDGSAFKRTGSALSGERNGSMSDERRKGISLRAASSINRAGAARHS